MSQHLLMGDLGALLIVLGLTGPLLQPLLHNRWFSWMRHLAHPLVALPLWAVDLYVWHAPVLYQAATEHSAIHALQHSCFIGFGVLMWMPLVGPLPQPKWFGIPAKIGYLIGVRFVGIVLGNIFMWSGSVFYPDYAVGEAKWHISAVSDQSIAGVIMMVESTFVTLGVLAWLFLQWAKQDTERQRLLDLAEQRGVPLSEGRAARAAAAGQGARLEERIKEST
jgi:putative membrane protein